MLLRISWLVPTFSLGLCSVFAHAAVVDVKTAKAAVSATYQGQYILVGVKPPEGTKLNFDGPWKLKFSDSVPVAQKKLGKNDFDKSSGQFKVPVTGGTFTSGDYALTYFMCDKENKWCKRMVDKGQITKK